MSARTSSTGSGAEGTHTDTQAHTATNTYSCASLLTPADSFSFCNYPFILEAGTKGAVLTFESRVTQEHERRVRAT